MNDAITVRSTDGSTWIYRALYGPDYSAEETGWVLTVENSVPPLDPQWVTPEEAIGDLESMGLTDPPPAEIVIFFTQQMIQELDQRASALEAVGRPAEAERARGRELRQELQPLLPLPADSS